MKISLAKKGVPNTKLRGVPVSDSAKKKQSETMKARYALGEISPWNKGKTGCFSIQTRKKMSERAVGRKISKKSALQGAINRTWAKNPLFKDGRKSYIQHFIRSGGKPTCSECDKKGQFGKFFHVHHIDGNRRNNKISNLKCLCSSCHRLVHERGSHET